MRNASIAVQCVLIVAIGLSCGPQESTEEQTTIEAVEPTGVYGKWRGIDSPSLATEIRQDGVITVYLVNGQYKAAGTHTFPDDKGGAITGTTWENVALVGPDEIHCTNRDGTISKLKRIDSFPFDPSKSKGSV